MTRRFVVAVFAILLASPFGFGQTASPTPGKGKQQKQHDDKSSSNSTANDDDDKPKKEKRGSWIFAPIPIVSPTFGSGLIMAVGYVFKLNPKDELSPPSTIGGAAAFTSSGSRAGIFGGRLYFSENKYQTSFAVGKGRANYDFFGIGRIPGSEGISTEIKQSGSFIFGEFMRNFGKRIFVGPRYQYRKLTVHLGGEPTPGGFEIPAIDLVSTTAAIGFHVQRDLRDSVFYPRKGTLMDFKADFFAKPLGSNRDYQTYSLTYSGFRSIGPKRVLAYNAKGCSVSDTAPFFDLCFFGASSVLRGYTGGEFQDRRLLAGQVEYRQELRYRLGFVAFAGIGGIAPSWDKFRLDKIMPSAGAGIRFKLDKTNHINYRADFGFGRAGYTISLGVTEAF
ncbi:MAG: hypothetical protein DMF63_05445 [Acidobacteria bacterium]|nr:MAG: hypothetical protein DMF63_05445 [Acidobacteriota bacterium]